MNCVLVSCAGVVRRGCRGGEDVEGGQGGMRRQMGNIRCFK